ncbi:hypothetical protein BC938DRAFT_481379 [Jimgerdemannia flammicorona]|uniref:Uncharacterized protein n=1 Tax=Jimgerdemannia flammicorona TaxID=994334 RepID=A0A433QGC2_9FUNG|nr:hypothetical protein BC938DRAFT_481379 [Jimgerdemannia flammicorona]
MRDVDIRYTETRRVTPVLHHWQHLEKFGIYDPSSDLVSAEADRLAITLATHCPHLVEVVFQHSEEGPQMSSQAMCYLLGRCHNLTHLGASSSRLNDRFLLILASCQPHLERLILPKCEGIAGLMVTKFKDALAWPELRQLVLDGCNSVSPEFIEKMVRDCSKLRTVALKQEYDELMVRLAFQLEVRNDDFESYYMERNRSRFTMV